MSSFDKLVPFVTNLQHASEMQAGFNFNVYKHLYVTTYFYYGK